MMKIRIEIPQNYYENKKTNFNPKKNAHPKGENINEIKGKLCLMKNNLPAIRLSDSNLLFIFLFVFFLFLTQRNQHLFFVELNAQALHPHKHTYQKSSAREIKKERSHFFKLQRRTFLYDEMCKNFEDISEQE